MRWAMAGDEMDLAAKLCGALWTFWQVRGYLSEGRDWLDKVLAHAEHISPPALARAMRGAGELARDQGDYQEAASLHESSLAILTDLGDKEGMADVTNALAVDVHYMGSIDQAEKLYHESLELWRTLGDAEGMTRTLNFLGLIALYRNELTRAADLFRQIIAVRRANKNKRGLSGALYNLSLSLINLQVQAMNGEGEEGAGMSEAGAEVGSGWEEAERCLTEGLALAREMGDKYMIALSVTKMGELSLERGDESSVTEATALFEDGLSLHRERGDRTAIAYALTDLGFAALLRGDRVKAHSHFEEGLRLSRALADKGKITMNLRGLAVTAGVSALASDSGEGAELGARRAVQLHSASETLPLTDHIRARARYYRATMDALRTLLGQDEIAALQSLGQKMSMEEAIEFALASGEDSVRKNSAP
jgi:tetratricopeptide (TPR) repeat protein